jgi:hypothetical protein
MTFRKVWRRIGAPCALALALGPPVFAAPPPSPETPRQNKASPQSGTEAAPTAVSGVTVTASRETPKVVGAYPAQGSSVAPGILIIRVTYDTRMQGQSWSYVSSRDGDYPECAASPRLLDDHKSFALICRTSPKKTYALWFNHGDYQNFTSVSRRPATTPIPSGPWRTRSRPTRACPPAPTPPKPKANADRAKRRLTLDYNQRMVLVGTACFGVAGADFGRGANIRASPTSTMIQRAMAAASRLNSRRQRGFRAGAGASDVGGMVPIRRSWRTRSKITPPLRRRPAHIDSPAPSRDETAAWNRAFIND